MANEVTLTNLETAVQACVTALQGGNYSVAKQKLAEATLFWAFLPANMSTASRAVGYKSQIDAATKAIEAHELAANGADGTQIVPMSFANPG